MSTPAYCVSVSIMRIHEWIHYIHFAAREIEKDRRCDRYTTLQKQIALYILTASTTDEPKLLAFKITITRSLNLLLYWMKQYHVHSILDACFKFAWIETHFRQIYKIDWSKAKGRTLHEKNYYERRSKDPPHLHRADMLHIPVIVKTSNWTIPDAANRTHHQVTINNQARISHQNIQINRKCIHDLQQWCYKHRINNHRHKMMEVTFKINHR